MILNSTSDSSSIFKDGKSKSGIYTVQNIYAENYLDIEIHWRDVCCRPAKDLGEGRGLWEIKQLGPGYTIQRFDPGEPEQFCAPSNGLQNGTTLCVGGYPVAWRVETVNDDDYRGFGYVRFYWATNAVVWDLESGRKDNGARVVAFYETSTAWQMWRLVPAKVVGAF